MMAVKHTCNTITIIPGRNHFSSLSNTCIACVTSVNFQWPKLKESFQVSYDIKILYITIPQYKIDSIFYQVVYIEEMSFKLAWFLMGTELANNSPFLICCQVEMCLRLNCGQCWVLSLYGHQYLDQNVLDLLVCSSCKGLDLVGLLHRRCTCRLGCRIYTHLKI